MYQRVRGRASGDIEGGEGKLAYEEPSAQPSDSQGPARRRRVTGHRRHRDTDDGEDCGPIEDSDSEHSQDDVVRQPRLKRRK